MNKKEFEANKGRADLLSGLLSTCEYALKDLTKSEVIEVFKHALDLIETLDDDINFKEEK